MDFIKHFITIFRTNPAAPAMARILNDSFEVDGFSCPPKTTYVFAHYHMGNSPRFIQNPEIFSPERWLRSGDVEKMHPFLILPFGHGPRMCVGKRFAMQEVSIVLAKILQNYSIEWHYPEMGMITETITKPSVPLTFTFKDR